jgi:hypothetical protein
MQPNGGQPHRATYRFVHASGLDLDAPMRGIPAPPAPLRAALRDAALRSWQALVECAIEHEAAFVVLAGGLFGQPIPALRSSVALYDGIERLRSRGIEVLIALDRDDAVTANHLPWLARSASIFAPNAIGTVRIVRDGRSLAIVRGISGDVHAARATSGLQRLGEAVEIGVLPLSPEGGAGAGVALADLSARTGLDYWALGGAGSAAVLHEDPWIVCAGTTQGRGWDAHQLGAKGCMVVDVTDGRIGRVVATPVDHVRLLRLELDVSGCTDAAAIRRLLARELERATSPVADRVVAVEATLRGRRPSIGRHRLHFEAELLVQLRRESAARELPVWWARVRDLSAGDERQLATGPWELRRILTEQSEALGAPLPGSTFLARTFAPLLHQWDVETDLAAQRELVRDAATLALDAFSDEESA